MDKAFNKIIKSQVKLTILSVVAVILITIGTTYALFSTTHRNTENQTISIGEINAGVTGGTPITLSDIYPIEESEIANNIPTYTFTMSNPNSENNYPVNYELFLEDVTSTIITTAPYNTYTQITSDFYNYIMFKLDGNESASLGSIYNSTSGKFILKENYMGLGESENHTLKFWISSTAPNSLAGKVLSLKLGMTAVATTEKIYFAGLLKSKANPSSNTNYTTSTAAEKAEMYTFEHATTEQTPAQTDYRYIGSNPNNYVYFNCTNPSDTSTCETWRILGVFPVDDGTGTYTDRVKLIRADRIGSIAWDTTASRGATYNNEWVGSNLAKILNTGDYYTRGSSYSSTGLTTSAKSMIDTAKWYLGAVSFNDRSFTVTYLYTNERGTTAPSGTTHNTSTTAYKVGLMYPSDYVYTYANGVDQKCFEEPYSCDESDYETSWLFDGYNEWVISPCADNSYNAWYLNFDGGVRSYGDEGDVVCDDAVRPVVYLKSGIEIDTTATSADGSSNHPYILMYD